LPDEEKARVSDTRADEELKGSEEAHLAKGQIRSNREIRKPKKTAVAKAKGPALTSVTSAFATPVKAGKKR
jgi:hypothetical protein